MQLSDAYRIILDLQKSLHSEYATSANIDEVFNRKLSTHFKKDFQSQQIADKNYYSRIFFLIYSANTKKNPFINSKSLLIDNIQRQNEVIPIDFLLQDETESLFHTLLKLVESDSFSPIFEDFITFSIIPSLFLMFVEEDSFDLYCSFINRFKKKYEKGKIAKPYHYSFGRSLFLSPMFVRFIRLILYPIINKYCDGHSSPNYQNLLENFQEDIQNQILESFEKNACYIPSYMKLFFDTVKDTTSFMKNCLFEPMIKNPELFLIVDNSITDYEDVMNHVRSILKIAFTDAVIVDISKCIDDCQNSEKALFIQQKNEDSIQYHYKKVCSSLDLDAFKFISKSIEEKESKNDFFDSLNGSDYQYCLYGCLYEDEEEGEDDYSTYLTTQVNKKDFWMHFRKLLKEGLPLPLNYQPPNQIARPGNFKKMVKDLLVDACDPFMLINALNAFKMFENELIEKPTRMENFFQSEIIFRVTMKSLIMKHEEQEKAMNMMSQYRQELATLRLKKESTISLIQELYNTVMTKSLIPKNQREVTSIEILSNIQKYNEEFYIYLAQQNEKSLQLVGDKCSEIWFRRFYRSINFSNYSSFRSDLQKMDEMARKVFQGYISIISKTVAFERDAIAKVITRMDLFENQFLQLNQVFLSNSDPITKIKEFENVMDRILMFFQTHFNVDGENDLTPFRSVVIAYVNPDRFFTNMIYFSEFLIHKKNSIVLNGNFSRIFTSFQIIYNEMNSLIHLSTKYYYFSRLHRRYLDVFITGNDPVSIVDLFGSFVSLTDNPMPNKDELNKYLEKIRCNPKEPIRYVLNFESFFNSLKKSVFPLDVSIIANFYIGQDINLTSGSKESVKLALFAYKNGKKGPINKFISTSDVDNSKKFVECKSDENADALKIPKSILAGDLKKISDSIITNILKEIK